MIDKDKINCIPIYENNEPLVDLKNQHVLCFGPPPDNPYPGTLSKGKRSFEYSD